MVTFPSPNGDFVFYMIKAIRSIQSKKFPSPNGDFVFYITRTYQNKVKGLRFPSPNGDFVFYMRYANLRSADLRSVSVP